MSAVTSGWNRSETGRTERVQEGGCMVAQTISGELTFPQRDVLLCGVKECPMRSDHVGPSSCIQS